MARWHQDDVDVACEAWAYQWVQNFALAPDRAGRTVGPLGCTLGRVHEMGDGASSNTERDRHWPEVYIGQGLIVAIARKALRDSQQDVMWHHYVGRRYDTTTWKLLARPTKQTAVADRLGVSLAEYYNRRDTMKACIRCVLTLDTKALASAPGLVVSSGQAA
jgi:hypothetical protein